MSKFTCGCGALTGERCCWEGDASDMVVIEFMPEWLRGTHGAAGADGIEDAGSYPCNGAERAAVERSCASLIIESEPRWVMIVNAKPERYAEVSEA